MAEDDVINLVCGRIEFDINKIRDGALERIEVESFNLTEFWTQFGAAVQSLSNEVTKVSFTCGKKPFPGREEIASLMQDVLQHYNIMRELYQVLPEEVGKTVFQGVSDAVLHIMTGLLDIVRSLHHLTDKGAKERLVLTGTFWDACNAVETLPRNNVEATLKVVDEESSLVTDALQELSTTIEEDLVTMGELGDMGTWTSAERELATRAVGLVKVTQVCLQRLRKALVQCGSSSTPQHCTQLDHTVGHVRSVSPALDDFVSELYHSIDTPTALEMAGKLAEVLRGVLATVKGSHFEAAIDSSVLSKLEHFISHNHRKLDPSITAPVAQLAHLHINT